MRTCPWCDRATEARNGCRECVEYARATLRAPAVTAARVLLIISAVIDLLHALFGAAGAVGLAFLGSAMSGDDLDDMSDASSGVTSHGALALLVISLLVLVVLAIAQLRIQIGLERRESTARTQLGILVVANFVLQIVMLTALQEPGALVLVVMAVPWSATVLALIWVPDSSRRWFGDLTPLPPPPLPPSSRGVDATWQGWPGGPIPHRGVQTVSPYGVPPVDPVYAAYAATPSSVSRPVTTYRSCPSCRELGRSDDRHCRTCGTRLPAPIRPWPEPA